jgi:hypothetical protein
VATTEKGKVNCSVCERCALVEENKQQRVIASLAIGRSRVLK